MGKRLYKFSRSKFLPQYFCHSVKTSVIPENDTLESKPEQKQAKKISTQPDFGSQQIYK